MGSDPFAPAGTGYSEEYFDEVYGRRSNRRAMDDDFEEMFANVPEGERANLFAGVLNRLMPGGLEAENIEADGEEGQQQANGLFQRMMAYLQQNQQNQQQQ